MTTTAKVSDDDILYIKDRIGRNIELVEYDGYYLGRNAIESGSIPDPSQIIPQIIQMTVREDDVFLVAYPKAGTHWTNEIVQMLLQRRPEYQRYRKGVFMLPFQTVEKIDELPSPRAINSHMYFRHLPKDILQKKNKLIFVNRNPKDIAVSFYHHCQTVALKYGGTWEDFLEFFMSDRVVYHCPWYLYMLDWERVMIEHSDLNILVVNFEDLKKNPAEEVKRIGMFLDCKESDNLYHEIAEKCGFKQLKDDYKTRPEAEFYEKFFRKGEVGGWKDMFTVAQNERFDNYLKDKLRNSKWKFIYSI